MRAVTSIQVSPLFFSVVLSNFGNLYQLRYRLNYLPMALNLIWKGGASLTGRGVQTIWGGCIRIITLILRILNPLYLFSPVLNLSNLYYIANILTEKRFSRLQIVRLNLEV